MTNTITRLQALITQAEAQTDKLPIVALHDEDIQALRDAVMIDPSDTLSLISLCKEMIELHDEHKCVLEVHMDTLKRMIEAMEAQ